MDSEELHLALFEHIQHLAFEFPGTDIPEVDGDEVQAIAEYLINEEELYDLDRDQLLMIGLFIHGYQHRNDDQK